MQLNAVASVERKALKMDSPVVNAPAPMRAANDGPATRQLQFAYLPAIAVKPSASATAELLVRWLRNRSVSLLAARPMPDFRNSRDALSNADRFCLGHADLALKNLQSMGIAGRTVIHLSTSCLKDPLSPVYVISLFQRLGVSPVGIDVTLTTGRLRRLNGRVLHDAVPEFSALGRHHTDQYPSRQPAWVNAFLGRFGVP